MAAEGPQRARDECAAGFGYRLAGYLLAGFGRLCQPVEAKQIRGGSGHATIAPQASATCWQASATGWQASVACVSELKPEGPADEGPQRARDDRSAGFGYRLAGFGYLLAGFGRLYKPLEFRRPSS